MEVTDGMMRIDLGDVELAVEVRGEGPPVLLIHGWPDDHTLWRHQVPELTAAGFSTIAPDLRGFGRSSRPTDVEDYAMQRIVGDLLGVLDHLGVERACVVGHDWGAAIAWVLASLYPDRVERLAVISVGSVTAYHEAGLAQREKSWYMLLFQFPGVAEQWLSESDFRNFRDLFRHPDSDTLAATLADRDRLAATLAIYRANMRAEVLVTGVPPMPPVAAPTLGLWSTGDPALIEASVTGSARHVSGPWRYERIDGVGHWIMLEAPDRVNRLLLQFLGKRVPALG
jgi:pimeloyl-ACP methyl ester carboxylesterase